MATPITVEFIPHELICDIVSRLPSNSLSRFRCVSKSWSSTILEVIHSRKVQRIAVLLSVSRCWSFDIRTLVLDDDDEEDEKEAGSSKLFALEPSSGYFAKKHIQILASYGGLLLLSIQLNEIHLFNPTTSQHKKVLESPLDFYQAFHSTAAGFCYDSALDDYKVIFMVRRLAHIATFKRKTWKQVEVKYRVSHKDPGRVVDGKIHWLVRCDGPLFRTIIIAFHTAEDIFVEMPVPGDNILSRHSLGILDGCLVWSSWYQCNNTTYIWVMKKYGVNDSWTLLFDVENTSDFFNGLGNSTSLRPLFFTKEGRVLLELVDHGRVIEYDMKKKSYRYIRLPDKKTQVKSIITFEESLSFPHDAYVLVR